MNIKDARKAIRKKEYQSAIDMLNSLVARDDSDAILELAFLYLRGEGLDKDIRQAEGLLNQAADLGNVDAEYQLGVGHQYSLLVNANPAIARDFYERAAQKGHANAQYQLGCMDRDEGRLTAAIRWWKEAGAQGHLEACEDLVGIYSSGADGILPDEEQFRKWLKKGADSGDILAMNRLGELYRSEGNYTAAFEYFQKGAKKGWSDALTNLGLAYKNGEGTVQNLHAALECFESAERKGNISATYRKSDMIALINSWNLYLFYKDGTACKQDDAQAFVHCARNWRLPEAKLPLAQMSENGIGTPRNLKYALERYSEAAELGFAGASAKVEELKQLIAAEVPTMSEVHRHAVEILRSSLAAELAAGFPLLKKIPRTSIFHLLDYLETLDEEQKQLFIDGLAFFSSDYLLVDKIAPAQRVDEWQKHQGVGPFFREVNYFKKLPRYPKITSFESLDLPLTVPTLVREEFLRTPGTVAPAKATLLRRLTDAAMSKAFANDFRQENLPGGNRVYRGTVNGNQLIVHVHFSPKGIGQLRYQVQLVLEKENAPIEGQRVSLERLWFQSDDVGWDYLTDENAERCIDVLPDLIRAMSDIFGQLYR
ncbi:MAG: sel1 repeat family protein [Cyanobacteria bacterium]|nr:sel1 repeat family protein [Cyanobacteriota bacterium]